MSSLPVRFGVVDGAVRSGDDRFTRCPVVGRLDAPPLVVVEVVVVGAAAPDVAGVGGAAVVPVFDVVAFVPRRRRITAREEAVQIPMGEDPPEDRGCEPAGAPVGERGAAVGDDRRDIRAGEQTPQRVVGEVVVRFGVSPATGPGNIRAAAFKVLEVGVEVQADTAGSGRTRTVQQQRERGFGAAHRRIRALRLVLAVASLCGLHADVVEVCELLVDVVLEPGPVVALEGAQLVDLLLEQVPLATELLEDLRLLLLCLMAPADRTLESLGDHLLVLRGRLAHELVVPRLCGRQQLVVTGLAHGQQLVVLVLTHRDQLVVLALAVTHQLVVP